MPVSLHSPHVVKADAMSRLAGGYIRLRRDTIKASNGLVDGHAAPLLFSINLERPCINKTGPIMLDNA